VSVCEGEESCTRRRQVVFIYTKFLFSKFLPGVLKWQLVFSQFERFQNFRSRTKYGNKVDQLSLGLSEGLSRGLARGLDTSPFLPLTCAFNSSTIALISSTSSLRSMLSSLIFRLASIKLFFSAAKPANSVAVVLREASLVFRDAAASRASSDWICRRCTLQRTQYILKVS
jgi:hypothetical protein